MAAARASLPALASRSSVLEALRSPPARAGRSRARHVSAAAGGPDGKPQPQKRPTDDPEYYSRLLKLEADPVPRDNLTSNLKLAAGITALLGGLVYAFLASNGAV